MSLFILLFAAVGAAAGYFFATNVRSNSVSPMIGAGLGAVGGLIGGTIIRAVFLPLIGLIGAVLGAAILFWAYQTFGKR